MSLPDPESEPLLRQVDPDTTSAANVEDLIDAKTDPDVAVRWGHETRILVTNSAQLSGAYLLQYFYNLVIILVVSRLGRDELAAVSVGITTMNITGFAIFEGLATSLDTLCSQAFGSGKLKHVGLHMQRMILLLFLVATPVGAIWICSPWILVRLIPQPQLAPLAGRFLRVTLLGLPGYCVFEAGKRFVQAQGDFQAALIVLIICAPINVLLNWLFVFRLDWGVGGAALAAALTNDLRAVLLLLYVVFITPAALQCWQRPTKAVFKNWKPMIWLSIPSALMTLTEWFPFEILTFSTAYLGTAQLAAQTLLATISILVWHIPFSAGVVVSTRIGHLIGAGALNLAKKLTILYGPLFLVLGLIEMAALLLLRDPIATVFTHDPEVRNFVKETLPLVAIFVIFDATTCFCHGILRGLGRQVYGGWVAFVINFCYSIPVAIYLELGKPNMGLFGVWIATTTCLVIVTLTECIILRIMNWQRCVDEARERETDHD
jgi:multidrug resistance protein, MATE family